MPKFPGVNHQQAVRAFERAGFRIARQSGHIVMTDGTRVIAVPRHNPIHSITMGNLIRDAGLTNEEFREFL